MIYPLIFSFLISLFLAFFLYKDDKKFNLLFFLRFLSLFLILLFIFNLSFSFFFNKKVSPILLIERSFYKNFKKNIDENFSGFERIYIHTFSELLNVITGIPEKRKVIYAGYGEFSDLDTLVKLIERKKIKFSYIYSKELERAPFSVYPNFLIRKSKNEGFIIEGKDIEIEVIEEGRPKEKIPVKGKYLFIPDFIPNKTRKIILSSGNYNKKIFVTDIDDRFYIKIDATQFHPVIGYIRRFFEKFINSAVVLYIKGKRLDTFNVSHFDISVNVFKENNLSPSLNFLMPDKEIKGKFVFPFELSAEMNKMDIKGDFKDGKVLLAFKVDEKEIPLIIMRDSSIFFTSPDIWKIDILSKGKFSEILFGIIKENFFNFIKPKVIPLFSEVEKGKSIVLSFYIMSLSRISDIIKFKVDGKNYLLKKREKNIYYSEPLNLKEGLHKIEIFDQNFNFEVIEKKEKILKFINMDNLEFLRILSDGKRIDMNKKFASIQEVKKVEKRISFRENLLLLLLFILIYSFEIYLRKTRGLL